MINKKNIILTAADEGFFNSFCQFAQTFKSVREYRNSELICFDLGFTIKQKQYAKKLVDQIPQLSVRTFEFSKYPDIVQLSNQSYSFKPVIVHEVFEEYKCNLLWLDSATILLKPLDYVWSEINKHGVYAPIGGSGFLKEWTLQSTLDYMEVPKEWYPNRNICGCMCGFGYHNSSVVSLVSEWEKYGLIKECIIPDGADRYNHKHDQSILTILLYRYQRDANIHLTKDEVNISSPNPIDFLSVRNKVIPNLPWSLIPLATWWNKFYRLFDIWIVLKFWYGVVLRK